MKSQKTAAAMIVQSGRVVAQWVAVSMKIQPRSVPKSVRAPCRGFPWREGHIDLGQTLAQLGIDDNEPSLTEIEKPATVPDLAARAIGGIPSGSARDGLQEGQSAAEG
jgi:hypothetical protein